MKFNLLGGCPTSWEMRGIWLQVSGEVTAITQREGSRKRAAAIANPRAFISYVLFDDRMLFFSLEASK